VVVVPPCAVVLVPLPDVAVERGLPVDLELVHVHRLAEDLHDGPDHPRMARQARERLAVQVRREVGADGIAAFLAHVLPPLLGVEPRDLVGQQANLLRREEAREEKVALAIETLELLGVQLHVVSIEVTVLQYSILPALRGKI